MNNIIEIFGKDKITFRSRDLLSRSLLPERIELVERIDYKLFVHDSIWGSKQANMFTIILTANGNNVGYFKESIESVLKQTAKNIELILVDHGCEYELKKLMYDYFLSDEKIKLITLKENIYDPFDGFLDDRVFNVINAALFCSQGDYIYFLSFDDFLSENYVESMLTLFLDNPNCVVASPAVVSINELSEVNADFTKWLSQNNLRAKYISGFDLATSVMRGGNVFDAPGGLFAYKTALVLASGGLDSMNDLSQIYKFAIIGEVGTHQEAVLYWRHHQNQTNKINKSLGALYYTRFNEWIRHIKAFYIEKRIPEVFQKDFSVFIPKYIKIQTLYCIEGSIGVGLQSTIAIFKSILKEAPKIYILYFIYYLLKEVRKRILFPIRAYIPKKYKKYYRSLRSLFILKFRNHNHK